MWTVGCAWTAGTAFFVRTAFTVRITVTVRTDFVIRADFLARVFLLARVDVLTCVRFFGRIVSSSERQGLRSRAIGVPNDTPGRAAVTDQRGTT